jgi:hypothetical protein
MEEVSEDFVRASSVIYGFMKIQLKPHLSKFSPPKFTLAQILSLELVRYLANGFPPAQIPIAYVPQFPDRDKCLSHVAAVIQTAGRISFRRLTEMLRASKAFRDALELQHVPNYSTICKVLRSARNKKP